jgi:hypothetical protein
MPKPLGFYASARSDHPDADILVSIEEAFGPQLQELTDDDKAAVLICLVDAATNTQQVFIQDNFFTSHNGGELWELAQKLTSSNQLAFSVALVTQLAGGQQ